MGQQVRLRADPSTLHTPRLHADKHLGDRLGDSYQMRPLLTLVTRQAWPLAGTLCLCDDRVCLLPGRSQRGEKDLSTNEMCEGEALPGTAPPRLSSSLGHWQGLSV